MKAKHSRRVEIRVHGKSVFVPAVEVDDHVVIASKGFLKVARVFDEELVEGPSFREPAEAIKIVADSSLRADLLTFTQRPPDVRPRYAFDFEWDNWAVAPTSDFDAWWKGLPQESRKNVRLAEKKGIAVRTVAFDDKLVEGIRGIYDETPVRQGKRFWHYGKDFARVKMENETYRERSTFVGAYFGEELIGFIKYIRTDDSAILIQILAKAEHHRNRPMNALLAHTMKQCAAEKLARLVYGQYVYGRKNDSSLTEFKRRNGFQEVKFPRYFVPLSRKGRIALASGLHLGLDHVVPKPVWDQLLKARARALRARDIFREGVFPKRGLASS